MNTFFNEQELRMTVEQKFHIFTIRIVSIVRSLDGVRNFSHQGLNNSQHISFRKIVNIHFTFFHSTIGTILMAKSHHTYFIQAESATCLLQDKV